MGCSNSRIAADIIHTGNLLSSATSKLKTSGVESTKCILGKNEDCLVSRFNKIKCIGIHPKICPTEPMFIEAITVCFQVKRSLVKRKAPRPQAPSMSIIKTKCCKNINDEFPISIFDKRITSAVENAIQIDKSKFKLPNQTYFQNSTQPVNNKNPKFNSTTQGMAGMDLSNKSSLHPAVIVKLIEGSPQMENKKSTINVRSKNLTACTSRHLKSPKALLVKTFSSGILSINGTVQDLPDQIDSKPSYSNFINKDRIRSDGKIVSFNALKIHHSSNDKKLFEALRNHAERKKEALEKTHDLIAENGIPCAFISKNVKVSKTIKTRFQKNKMISTKVFLKQYKMDPIVDQESFSSNDSSINLKQDISHTVAINRRNSAGRLLRLGDNY